MLYISDFILFGMLCFVCIEILLVGVMQGFRLKLVELALWSLASCSSHTNTIYYENSIEHDL